MKYFKSLCLIMALAFMVTSCYHARITTGKTPSNTVVKKEWAHGFVYGLVPPSVVEVADDCPNGVAIVETEHSFLNMLAQGLTFGLYTPMTITVTCAAAPGTAALEMRDNIISTSQNAGMKEKTEAMRKAAQKSIDTGKMVYIDFN